MERKEASPDSTSSAKGCHALMVTLRPRSWLYISLLMLLLLLLLLPQLLFNVNWLSARWQLKVLGGSRGNVTLLSQEQQQRVARGEKTRQHKFVHDFRAGYELVQRLQNESLGHLVRPSLLPLLRVTEQELDRAFRVREGSRWMRRTSVVFAGTARNARSNLPTNIHNIQRLGALFKEYWIVAVENDSHDKSREYLHSVRRTNNRTVILGCEPVNSEQPCHLEVKYRSGKMHQPSWQQRRSFEDNVDRGFLMSVLRNMYLDYVYAYLADKVDLMIVVDLDIPWRPWDMDNIAQGMYYFSNRPQLDQLCATSIESKGIYDPCTLTYFRNKRFRMLPLAELHGPEATNELALKNNSIPVKVESCFQAFAAYRFSSLFDRRLHYFPMQGEWNCEHNMLARQLGEVYIDPGIKFGVNY